VNQLEQIDQELDTILTSFDTSYAWNYGSVKEGFVISTRRPSATNGTAPPSSPGRPTSIRARIIPR